MPTICAYALVPESQSLEVGAALFICDTLLQPLLHLGHYSGCCAGYKDGWDPDPAFRCRQGGENEACADGDMNVVQNSYGRSESKEIVSSF